MPSFERITYLGHLLCIKDEKLGKFGRAPYGVATFRASLRSVLRTLRPYMRLTHPHTPT
jgi:hypothetical protein